MQEDVTINKIEWSALEYSRKEHSTDWYWAVGLITLAIIVATIWTKSYLFALFILISSASLILFSLRHPQEVIFSIETKGLRMGRDNYPWEKIKGFNIRKREEQNKLLIEIDKYFLPVYTIPVPSELVAEIKETLLKVKPVLDLKESRSMQFIEKLGL